MRRLFFVIFIVVVSFGIFLIPKKPAHSQATICASPYYSVATPLTDLGGNTYRRLISTNPIQYQDTTEIGGLYPNGLNIPPAPHAQAATQISQTIEPLNTTGSPDANGKIVMVSIGMSNTATEFGRFIQLANADPEKNPRLTLVNGAFSGATADIWANPSHNAYPTVWNNVMNQFSATTTTEQVQVAWIKLTTTQGGTFPQKAQELQGYLQTIVLDLKNRFPNLKIIYFSSRAMSYTYFNGLSPEPNAYETAFSVRWLIEDQINGSTALRYTGTNPPAPLLLWGPYLWVNGTAQRSDGRTWPQSYLKSDCTHPSVATDAADPNNGTYQVADMLLSFFKASPYTTSWFLADGITPPPPSPTPTIPASCTTPGNANCDGSVNLSDLSIVLANFGQGGLGWSQGDFDGNGTVTLSDLSALLSNFGQTTPNPTATPTPQPLTIQFTPDQGTFTSSFNLDLYVPQTPTYEIYYTTNGTTPNNTGNGTLYNGNLTISQTTTVRAIAYAAGYSPSTVHVKTYTVSITNQAPSANNQILNTNTNTALPITLSYTDSDGPGPFVYTIVSNPTHGTLSGTGGSRTYTPTAGYAGQDSFTWRVNDGQANSNTATVSITVSSATSSALIFDHTDVVSPQNMSRIPIQYLDTARNRRVFFRHASIGFNIFDGLECMMDATPANYCRATREQTDPTIFLINDPSRYSIPNFAKFSVTSQWVEECHSLHALGQDANCNPIAHEKSGMFLRRLNGETWVSPDNSYPQTVDTSLMQILMFKFGNVDDQSNSEIATWYFTPGHQYTDIYDLIAYDQAHPNQTIVYWPLPLGRQVTVTSQTFNQNIRSVAVAEDLVLFDLAAITSHLPNGTPCVNASGIPNLCDEYTDEVNGGHLNGYGKARVSQALWAFMARLSGWNGVLQ